MTASELRWTSMVLVAFGVLIGWALFGSPHILHAATKDSSIAEWSTVLVGAMSASAVLYLGIQANRLASAPMRAQENDRQREATFILSLVYTEVTAVRSVAKYYVSILTDAERREKLLRMNAEQRHRFLQQIQSLDVPLTQQVLHRLHVLEPHVGRALNIVLRHTRVVRYAFSNPGMMFDPEHGDGLLSLSGDRLVDLCASAKIVLEAADRASSFINPEGYN